MRPTTERPRPFPAGLVVKNGVKTFLRSVGPIPEPLSLISTSMPGTKSPSKLPACMLVNRLERREMVILPSAGEVASTAVIPQVKNTLIHRFRAPQNPGQTEGRGGKKQR